MSGGQVIALAAGGTGGHLFPAQALGEELRRRGRAVVFFTDKRTAAIKEALGNVPIHKIPAATFARRGPMGKIRAALAIVSGIALSFVHLLQRRPRALVAFGGYPSIPPTLAARLSGIPVILHEQNAVMGRANRALAPFSKIIAASVETPKGLAYTARAKVVVTGNPVRQTVIEASCQSYTPPSAEKDMSLLVYGGSQGARILSDVVPEALGTLPPELLRRLCVTQQCRVEDVARVTAAYSRSGIRAEIAAFFPDLPRRIAQTQLVIARSGASTVSELTVIGRPAIFVPLAYALDQDQAANAAIAAAAGGAIVLSEGELDAQRLARALRPLLSDGGKLNQMAYAMRSIGKADAVQHLADVVEACADRRAVSHRRVWEGDHG
jgi:UDP-N-acetylglucosamine--N-acetylmuramyl-(pentapeptide) pyrophosphoryl-undecaprenol N-acetylglucosamine transferase